jgi:mannose-6-phosphate isomerase-like protein (cupin superfamily)
MNRFMRCALTAGTLCLPAAVLAGDTPHKGGKHGGATQAVVTEGKDLKWGPGPAALPPGAQAVVLVGDPSKPGAFTMRAKVPANYRIAPHHHPADEHVTVISGTAKIGMGEQFDEAKMTTLGPGGYFAMPKGHRHYFSTTEETVIQLNGQGPWEIVYVNPADDPRKQKGAAKKGAGSAP